MPSWPAPPRSTTEPSRCSASSRLPARPLPTCSATPADSSARRSGRRSTSCSPLRCWCQTAMTCGSVTSSAARCSTTTSCLASGRRFTPRLAASLEVRRPERLGEIARHWSAAHDASRALPASDAAGRQALRAGAAAEAEGHLGRALELWNTVGDPAALVGCDRADLLVETAVAAEHARHLDRAIELALQAVAELVDVDPLREAEVWLQLRDLYRFSYRWDDCAEAVARALALIPAEPPSKARAEALAHAALGHNYANRPTEAKAHAREAVAVAELVGDPEILVYAHHALVCAAARLGDYDDALTLALANLARCGPDISAERTLTAYHSVAIALIRSRPVCRGSGVRRTGCRAGPPQRAQRFPGPHSRLRLGVGPDGAGEMDRGRSHRHRVRRSARPPVGARDLALSPGALR